MKRKATKPASPSQRGVAILIVLILVTLMSLLAVKMNGLFVSNFQRVEAIKALQTQQWLINSEEKRLLKKMAQPDRSMLSAQRWHRELNLAGTTWRIAGKLESAQRCFNLNTLAKLPFSVERADSEPHQRYLTMLAGLLAPAQDRDIAEALLQRFSALQTPASEVVRRKTLLYQENELPAAARAFIRDDRSSPLCLLPSRQARVDINQLTREQAPLLTALFTPYLSLEKAQALIAARPEGGWKTLKAVHQAWMKISYETSIPLSLFEELLSVRSHFWRSQITVTDEEHALTVSSEIYFSQEENSAFIWNHRYVY
ncbi:type II secretion system protein GspK [Pantoea osteomyelitidis]|uniref:Type II secretion system protein GspK n=1 Tax=Pantoea osteomyelitidis TaxID=3230026 RepID=A0ABW7PQQ2_9GAMM